MSTLRITFLVALCAAFAVVSTAGTAVAATNPSVEWSAAYGGPSDEFATSVEQTADGGYILAGEVLISDSGNRKDVLLVKTDASGNQQWSRTFSGSGWDSARDVVQTTDGGYAIAAESSVRTIPGSSKGWLIKTDASGNEQWSKTFGGGYYDRFGHLIQLADGGYVISGTADSASGGIEDVWLVKTNSSGNQQWSKTFGVGQTDRESDLIRTADGGFAIAGGSGANGWLLKTDAGGNQTWVKTYPGPLGGGLFNSVRQTGDGGYILAGACGAVNPNSVADAWVVKTDASGTQQWSKAYAGETDIATAVFVLPGGGYLVAGTGWYQGMATSDLGLFTVSPSGDQLWELVYGDGVRDEVYAGSQTADGGYVLAGLTSPYDMWLVKIKPGSSGGGGCGKDFPDVPASHPYYDAIMGMADAGVINGYDDCSFRPENAVWRQHFAKMIVGTLGFPCSEADICPYGDVTVGGPTTLYPDNYVAVAAAYGITKGIGGGNYGPYRNITRAQVITMVVRAAQQYTAGLQAPDAGYPGWGIFSGFSDPNHGYNAQLAEFNGLLNGLQGSGNPIDWIYQPATRGEVAQILWNLSNAGIAG